MKGLIVDIYESKAGNFSNGGISSNYKRVILIGNGVPQISEADQETPIVHLERRHINGQTYLNAYPDESFREPHSVGWMAGGSFIYSSDSRFPSLYPISLHDRQESPELNEMLSK